MYSQNFTEYYKKVNLAEIAISNNKWETAVECYYTAFTLINSPFAKDLHNAVICCLEIDSISRAIALIDKMLNMGCDPSYFQNKTFGKVINTNEYLNMLSERRLYKKKNFNINIKLRKEVEKRYKLDQNTSNPEREKVFEQNIKWLKQLMQLDSFPSEQKIGVYISNNIITHSLQELFLLHWSELDKTDTLNIIDMLQKNIFNGSIHPCTFANLSYGNVDGKLNKIKNFAFIVVGDSVLIPKFELFERQRIDSVRLNLCLHRLDDYQNIVRFSAFDNRFIFNNMRYAILENRSMINLLKYKGYEVIGDKKTILNLN